MATALSRKTRTRGVHWRRHLGLARGGTRTNTKGAVITMNTLQTGCPSNGFNSLLSSCLLAREEKSCAKWYPGHASQTWVLGWASLPTVLKPARHRGTGTISSPGHPACPSSGGHCLLLLHHCLPSFPIPGLGQAVPRAWGQPVFSDQYPAVGCSSTSLPNPTVV